jgi:hypothetical protein
MLRATVSPEERADADAAISAVVAQHRRTVDHVRVRITAAASPGGPGLAQVNLRVRGAAARVQVAGPSVAAAIDTAASRLRRQINRMTVAWEPWPWPDPERRSLGMPGPAVIARLKSFRLLTDTACQAAAILHAMDYDAYLFTDAEMGEDAIVFRSGPTGLCLARQRTMRPPSLPSLLPLTVNPRRTPTLSAAQAATRLAEGWLPFLFYTDHDTGRGNLLYRRYDGDLGLIAPTILDEPR